MNGSTMDDLAKAIARTYLNRRNEQCPKGFQMQGVYSLGEGLHLVVMYQNIEVKEQE